MPNWTALGSYIKGGLTSPAGQRRYAGIQAIGGAAAGGIGGALDDDASFFGGAFRGAALGGMFGLSTGAKGLVGSTIGMHAGLLLSGGSMTGGLLGLGAGSLAGRASSAYIAAGQGGLVGAERIGATGGLMARSMEAQASYSTNLIGNTITTAYGRFQGLQGPLRRGIGTL